MFPYKLTGDIEGANYHFPSGIKEDPREVAPGGEQDDAGEGNKVPDGQVEGGVHEHWPGGRDRRATACSSEVGKWDPSTLIAHTLAPPIRGKTASNKETSTATHARV